MSFTWKPIYKELAKNILEYEDRQSELLQLLRDLESEDLPVVITDKDAPNKTIQLMEIDPLTFFAAFNRSLTDENRIAILKHCRKVFGLAAEVPEDFVGLPLVNNQNTWYFGYHYVRDLEDIPTLWQLARFAVDAPDSSEMGLFFDKALGIHGIKMGKLTSGLFWLNPEVFLPAESNSRSYFEGSFGIEPPDANWESYCRYRNAVREKAGTDFATLSDIAYVYAGDPLRVQKDIAIFALPCAVNVDKKTWRHKVRAYTKPLIIAVNDALKNIGSELVLSLYARKEEPKSPEFLDRAYFIYDKGATQSITPAGEFTLHVQLSLNQADEMCLSWGIDYWQPLSAGEDTSVGEAFMNDLAQQTSAAVPCHPGMRRTWYFIHSQEYDADALAALDESIVEVIQDDMIKLDELVRSTRMIGGSSDPVFSEKTFDLLEGLHENPTKEFYTEHKSDFKTELTAPFKNLLKAVAEDLRPEMSKRLETQKSITSRIPKSDWAHGGAWDYYWGAFYPKGGKRTEDAQLFVVIDRDSMRVGFALGETRDKNSTPVFECLYRNCAKSHGELVTLLEKSLGDPRFFFGYVAAKRPKGVTEPPDDWRAWLESPETWGPRVALELSREEVLRTSAADLQRQISEIFQRIFPLFLLAVDDNPMPAIREFVRPGVPAKAPENLILYGPPGTGKTYATVYEALRLCAVEEPESREAAMETFKELRDRGRIEFVTFHQSFSYEEFVEGIRPEVDEDTKTVSYECRDGVFRKIVKSAMQNVSQRAAGYEFDESQIRFWKMSLGNTLDDRQAMIYEQCVDQNYILLGYGEELDFADCKTRQAVHKHLLTVKPDATSSDYAVTSVNLLVNQMEIGDIVIVSDGNAAFRAIGKITGEYRRLTEGGAYGQARDVEWLVVFDESLPRELIFEKHISQMSLYQLKPETLKLDTLRDLIRPQQSGEVLPHVLIIDEINRGNLSKIFGELITLLEPDKRIGAANELRVKLPYSNDDFGVPSNLSVLATMNTADRSIALMDVALRRRFTFRELMPDPSVLEDCMPNGTVLSDVDVPQLLECINLRIQFLYDRDHTIGHSYFVHVDSLDSLRGVLINRVIPLLQEYFYEDWEKICLVLGCRCDLDSGTQGNTHPLIKAKRLVEKEILGFDHDDYDDQFNYLVNPDFVEAEANELAKFFTNILVSIGPVAPE